jgi:probable phosphoglycerate mutase
MPPAFPPAAAGHRLAFVRHGATAPNLAQVRCGGDSDPPLAELGREQARAIAAQLAERGLKIGVIVTSDLQRTRETAAIVAAALGGLRVIVEPGFRERLLGEWNGMPIAVTEPWLRARQTPPGGEASEVFAARIARALPRLLPLLPEGPLLVASKGVGRVLGELLDAPGTARLDNAAVVEFDLNSPCRPLAKDCTV